MTLVTVRSQSDDNDDNDGDMSPSSEREELSPDLQSASGGGRHTRFAPRLIVSDSDLISLWLARAGNIS